MKKEIKINFIDFYNGFNKRNNIYYNILSQKYNICFSETPDLVFCSCFGCAHFKYKNCVKIFVSPENIIPDFNLYDYGIGYDYLDFNNRYFRKNYLYPDKTIQDRSFISKEMANRKFCNFIYSNNRNGEGAVLRQAFCKKLMEYKQIDCPGIVLNNMKTSELEPRNGDWVQSKINFLKNYKFTIAFENSSSDGYTTEKLYHPFFAGSIPIYFGNPLVTKDFNSKAFINCADYDYNWDAVIQKIIELDNNPDAYLKMLAETPMRNDYDFERQKKLENWLYDIIEKGNKPFIKDPLHFSEKIHNTRFSSKFKLFGITLFSIKSKNNQIVLRIFGKKITLQKGK